MGTEEVNLDGCTFHDIPIEEKIKDQSTTETQSVYADEIRKKSNPNPIHTKPVYRQCKERSGKVKNITQEHKNKRVTSNFDKCKNIKQAVISVLLAGNKMTARNIFEFIQTETPNNIQLRSIVQKEKLDINKIWGTMTNLKKSQLGRTALVEETIIRDSGQRKNLTLLVYSFNTYGRNFTLEEAVKISIPKKQLKIKRRKDIPKKKIKKAVKDQKLSRNVQQIIKAQLERMTTDFLTKAGGILQEEYKVALENMYTDILKLSEKVRELDSLKSLVNQLMINTPAEKLGKSFNLPTGIESIVPQTIKIDIPTNFNFHFTFKFD